MRTLLILLIACAAASTARADGLVLAHHGRLLDASDHPLSQAAVSMTFRFYKDLNPPAASETAVWESGACAVDVRDGHYSVNLGESCGTGLTGAAFPAAETRYLEVAIDGTVLRPRMRFGTVPTAAVAADAGRLSGRTLADLDARYARIAEGTQAQEGGLALTGAVVAASFEGRGEKLTHLQAEAIDGLITDAQLASSADFARLGENAVFTRDVSVAGKIQANSDLSTGGALAVTGAVTAGGTITAAGNVSATSFTSTGALSAGSVSTTGALQAGSVNATGDVVAAGKLKGDGSTITNLAAGAVTGRLATTNLPTNTAYLDATQTFTGPTLFVGGALRLATDVADCTTTRAGAVRFTGSTVDICDGKGWLRITHVARELAWWKFEEGTGTVAADTFSTASNGTLGAGVSWLPELSCKVGKCVQFDGTVGGAFSVPATIFDGLGDFTFSFWAKSSAGKTGTFMMSLLVTGNDNYMLLNGQLETTWSHWVLRRNLAGVHLYRDGVLADTMMNGLLVAPTYPLPTLTRGGTMFLAQDQDCPGGCLDPAQAFQGAMDEVKLFGYAVSDADIAAGLP